MSELLDQLADAEATVARIRQEIAAGPCREFGHDWQFHGGRNAGCGDGCGCSVPVGVCSKCGDCDYGDTPEADRIRDECAELRAFSETTAPAVRPEGEPQP